MDIINLFPTCIGKFKLGRELTEPEANIIFNQELSNNVGNFKSTDYQVLNIPELERLKSFFLNCVSEYIEEVYSPKNDLSPYVTQSWTTVTKTYQHHHKHFHHNSFISGVFYAQTEDGDAIEFYDRPKRFLDIEPKEWTYTNSKSWWVPAVAGELILFPSDLEHTVNTRLGEKDRVSLAFNTFLKGKICAMDGGAGLEL